MSKDIHYYTGKQDQLANIHQNQTAMDEMQDAIAAGKEVTVHENPISAYGFNGVGYIITDPQTGAGPYLIEGGGRGGQILLNALVHLALLITIAQLVITVIFALALFMGPIIAGVIVVLAASIGLLLSAYQLPANDIIRSIAVNIAFTLIAAALAPLLGAGFRFHLVRGLCDWYCERFICVETKASRIDSMKAISKNFFTSRSYHIF